MSKLKMSWVTEGGRLVCRWVESDEAAKGIAVSTKVNETTSEQEGNVHAGVRHPESRVGRAA
jgi:hypothetical protein